MVKKLISVILTLLLKLIGIILAQLIEILASVIITLLLKRPYTGGRASRCHLHSINKSTSRCYLYTTIESY